MNNIINIINIMTIKMDKDIYIYGHGDYMYNSYDETMNIINSLKNRLRKDNIERNFQVNYVYTPLKDPITNKWCISWKYSRPNYKEEKKIHIVI